MLQYEVEVRDKNGKLLSKEKRESKSALTAWVKWFATFLAAAYAGSGASQSINDTGNTGRTVPNTASLAGNGYHGGFMCGAGVSTYGIVVGSGTGAVTAADYTLTQITHGTGGSQLVHNAQSIEAVGVVGLVSSVRSTRTFTNNGGATVTVYEIGWYWEQMDSGAAARFFCAVRDLLASPQSVPVGATLTVRYTWSVTA